MTRVSNEVIVERIDGMKEHFNDKIGNLNKNINSFKKCFNEKTLPEIKENTKFREKAIGIFGAISFISLTFGGFFMWLITKAKFWAK